jgi:hypothetical protein
LIEAMGLRRFSYLVAIAISALGATASFTQRAPITGILLCVATAFLVMRARRANAHLDRLDDWLIALEGKDPFNPDVKPDYRFSGFATTFLAALRVANHPLLAGKSLFVFRDEVEDRHWRALVTRVRHGPHTHRERDTSSLGT